MDTLATAGVLDRRIGQRPGASVRLDGITKSYGPHRALNALDLDIAAGEFITFLGPSGSGKTTTLMLVAGFERPTNGEIFIDTRPVAALPPYRRNIGMVFQSYALFPHLTVAENVAFALKQRGVGRAERQGRCLTADPPRAYSPSAPLRSDHRLAPFSPRRSFSI